MSIRTNIIIGVCIALAIIILLDFDKEDSSELVVTYYDEAGNVLQQDSVSLSSGGLQSILQSVDTPLIVRTLPNAPSDTYLMTLELLIVNSGNVPITTIVINPLLSGTYISTPTKDVSAS